MPVRGSSTDLTADGVGSAAAYCPASCGELIQGEIDGRSFHVTAPINLYARSLARRSGAGESAAAWVGGEKAIKAVRMLLHEHRHSLPYESISLEVHSGVPKGKGMASSTADIVSACAAISRLLGLTLTAHELARLALRIEPSDGLMFEGCVVFDHKRGGLIRYLGEPPPIRVLAFDTGGIVDTVRFNRRSPDYTLAEEGVSSFALRLLCRGFAEQDPYMIGRAATISSILHQKRLPKRGLGSVVRLADKSGVYGVNVAHSGTMIGVLCDPDDEGLPAYFARYLPHLDLVGSFLLVGGGIVGLSEPTGGYKSSNVMVTSNPY